MGVSVQGTLTLTREGRGERAVIHVAGRLLTSNLPELETFCMDAADRLFIDLTNLHLADSNGIKALKALKERGVQLTGVSPRLLRLLKSTPRP
jgi:anti-anti-sigma regulatory factor